MLGEGFLRVLRYREERKFALATKQHKTQTNTCVDHSDGVPSGLNSDPHTLSTEPGPNKEELGPSQSPGLTAVSQAVVGLSIPGCSPALTQHPEFSDGLNTCSLLQHYPDLRLGQETGELGDPGSPLKSTIPVCSPTQVPICEGPHHSVHSDPGHQGPQELGTSVPDQGYLVMGASVTTSPDLPGSRLEPMTNSLLNGLLDEQLGQVYLQHLTDSLARCNSQLGNSLLHGLVPPPQPSSHQQQGPDSLEAGLVRERDKVISYLSTQTIAPCSSHFSSPVLRISEADNVRPQ